MAGHGILSRRRFRHPAISAAWLDVSVCGIVEADHASETQGAQCRHVQRNLARNVAQRVASAVAILAGIG